MAPTGQKRPDRSRSQLLSVAARLYECGGPHAVTVDAVLHQTKFARATFYRHFESVDRLRVAAFLHLLPECPAPIASGKLPERLLSAVTSQYDGIRSAPLPVVTTMWLAMSPSLGDRAVTVRDLEGPVAAMRPSVREALYAAYLPLLSSRRTAASIGRVEPSAALMMLTAPGAIGRLAGVDIFDYDRCAREAVRAFLLAHRCRDASFAPRAHR